MSKRIVLVDGLGCELFSGASVLAEDAAETPAAGGGPLEDARQGGPLESGIFFRGAPRLKKKGPRAA